jgi:hypothetical protein
MQNMDERNEDLDREVMGTAAHVLGSARECLKPAIHVAAAKRSVTEACLNVHPALLRGVLAHIAQISKDEAFLQATSA